jgi:hypothetical protein
LLDLLGQLEAATEGTALDDLATPSTWAPSWAACSLSMTWAGFLATELMVEDPHPGGDDEHRRG